MSRFYQRNTLRRKTLIPVSADVSPPPTRRVGLQMIPKCKIRHYIIKIVNIIVKKLSLYLESKSN
ncbi:hypothetical protein GIB67_002282 [Kingdonia uniflora]|uniref:Uncharacterized protein n=1 Tax=Kingdonia uniflora TaxID=39325 RepID=A0A7J7KWY8_9MAGN|nr:hypothetical protein GIB67_002282 [Kingdonia uniflora]